MRVLLVEPNYLNKYPPLGLMKISSFHKSLGDEVTFCKGLNKDLKNKTWDRIYISSLFTFHWEKTINTVSYYFNSIRNSKDIFIGGVMATLMQEQIELKFNITVVKGLLNIPGKIGILGDEIIDSLTPDYNIINKEKNSFLTYDYPTKNCFFAYSTRGCIRKCTFCAVPIIEPNFSNNISIKTQVNSIKEIYGDKKDLLLMDNNILASKRFEEIINEIEEIGYKKGSKFCYLKNNRKIYVNKYVDFNQGVDARLLTEEKMRLIAKIAINPLRIAFDDITLKDLYIDKVKLAAKYNIRVLSNYILFNYEDTPLDFYERLKINIELNEEFKQQDIATRVWSFPMRYSPVKGQESRDRKFIGKHWNAKYLRAIQCILIATHGVVGPRKEYFEKAFGKNLEKFEEILFLPEKMIIYRNNYKNTASDIYLKYKSLADNENKELRQVVLNNQFDKYETTNRKILEILDFYRHK